MRCLLLVALLVVPMVFAQETTDPTADAGPLRVLQESADDQVVTVGGMPTQEFRWTASDLVSLDVLETESGFRFTVGVESLEAPDPGDDILDMVQHYVYFEARGQSFLVRMAHYPSDQTVYATLYQFDQGYGNYRGVESLTTGIDVAAATLSALVPHQLLLDADGVQVRPGDVLGGFWARAASQGAYLSDSNTEGVVSGGDRMPDTGVGDVTLETRFGLVNVGHVNAHSDQPVRVSNGEATTFLFEVSLDNLAEDPDTFIASWEGGMSNWVVTFPEERVRVGAGETVTVPVLVTVPFAHEHGAYEAINVSFQSQTDPLTVGRIELGVRYTAVPQPAGHHDTLFLHSPGGFGFLNTIEGEEFPADEEEIGSRSSSSCSSSGVSGMLIPLSPQLHMGLDFDMDRVGEATWMVTSDAYTTGYSFSGAFVVSPVDDRPSPCPSALDGPHVVATLSRSDPVEIGATGGYDVVTSVITPTKAGDRVEFDPFQQLWFVLIRHSPEDTVDSLLSNGVTADVGTKFQLPLNEYHDDVDQFFSALSGIDLIATTPQQKLVNPGETALFQVDAENVGSLSGTYTLEVLGDHADWAEVLGDRTIQLAAGETRPLAVAVHVPATAEDGTLVDITLHATKKDDDNVRSLIRLLAETDTDEDHPDEGDAASLVDADLHRNTPVGPLLPLAAVVAVLALRRRRSA